MIRGTQFLILAEKLAAATTEAEWRSAVCRAYYAAFHEARDALQSMGFATPRAELAHAYLWRRLENCGHSGLAAAGSRLNQLRRERNRADYDVNLNVARQDAAAAVRSAEMIIKTFNSLNASELPAITDAIRNYEQHVLREPTWRNLPR